LDFSTFFITILLDLSIYLLIVISMNLEVGLTGIPNFGRVLAIVGGVFVTGAIPGRILMLIYNIQGDYINSNAQIVNLINAQLFHDKLTSILVLIMTVLISALIGSALGFMSSYPALRLREDYLAIMLLIAGTSLVIIGINYSAIVGGTLGVQIPAIYPSLLGQGDTLYINIAIIHSILAFLFLMIFNLISNSPMGRIMRAVRENENLVVVLGRDLKSIRGKAMALGGGIAGIAGSLYSFYLGSVFAGGFDNITWSFYPYLMLILGGAGTTLGSILGVLSFIITFRLLDIYKDILGGLLHFDPVWLQYMLFGIIIIIILIYRPSGIIRERARPLLKPKD